MLPIIDLNHHEAIESGKPKTTKHAQTFSVDKALLSQFKKYCKTKSIAVSPVVESLIEQFMKQVNEETSV